MADHLAPPPVPTTPHPTAPSVQAAAAPGTPVDDEASFNPVPPARTTVINSDALFTTDQCLNCGALLSGTFCAACGQKKAARIGAKTVRTETWERFRWFEWGPIKKALRVIPQPGTVARQYVMGMRKDHMHPMSLLLLVIGFLLIALGYTDYLKPEFPSEVAARMYELVKNYSKWSFSVGIVAVFISTWALFRKRMGYNLTELLAFSIYCQAVFIALQMANQLPLVLVKTPEMLKWHKTWSPWYMTGIQAVMLMVALKQFFLVDVRREGWRLLAAGALFAGLKWQATQLYARGVVELVMWQMGF
ncbi:DUF3667 domain-containing protein [Ottowia testudinis]|uniref:DUF3667 domain-containing protein n=1 Tax=Ottowia testudinis TaxID=2816950 RepID=A0A975CHA8_9BURK|nr:DUF3667 domain-containing protein [Ottowia testudinis]QTD44174.1 DUF3667 domain-containing protein [Ottowia testudinis]